MTPQESIQKIIWALLANTETPQEAVRAAGTLKPHLGQHAEQDFRNLLRAAGLFACDDDGFYVRYASESTPTTRFERLLDFPPATHLLSVPVPVEPRMRIAYGVFTGLLLKYLYKRHAVIPLQVVEGMAMLSAIRTPSDAVSTDAQEIWQSFQASDLARTAIEDGIKATFSALRRGRAIGAIELPAAWKGTEIEAALRISVAAHPKLFQAQSKAEKLQFTTTHDISTSSPAPLSFVRLDGPAKQGGAAGNIKTGASCLICGQHGELIQGGKFFLPENKKQWYEQPGPRDKFPSLCANCAYIGLLSGIVPSNEMSVLELPADNFLEVFALHEHLQGVSGLVALKLINRTASLSVVPSRYLLLSKSAKHGQMDSKTQVYMQLRNHEPLLRRLDRPMRVQVEGSQPNFWSEIHPHVAVGLSYFAHLPAYYETGDRKITAQGMTRTIVEGRPFAALYLATQARQPEKGFGFERDILPRGVRNFEREFIGNTAYAAKMAYALGGPRMDCNVYDDVISFSNYLLDLVRPLVEREVRKSGSAVSGIARKYTDVIARDFVDCRAAKFLYVVCQEADQAESQDDRWCKRQVFDVLNPGAKDDTAIANAQDELKRCDNAYDAAEKQLKDATDSDRASAQQVLKEAELKRNEAISAIRDAWETFRKSNPKTELESRLASLHQTHGKDTGPWGKFLDEVQARTLALLLINTRRARS